MQMRTNKSKSNNCRRKSTNCTKSYKKRSSKARKILSSITFHFQRLWNGPTPSKNSIKCTTSFVSVAEQFLKTICSKDSRLVWMHVTISPVRSFGKMCISLGKQDGSGPWRNLFFCWCSCSLAFLLFHPLHWSHLPLHCKASTRPLTQRPQSYYKRTKQLSNHGAWRTQTMPHQP